MTKYVTINEIQYPVYADLEDAQVYNNAIYGSAWSGLDATVQAQLLVEATKTIDSYKYTGSKVDENQVLKFPRISSRSVVSDDSVLTDLCCKVALYIYRNGSNTSGSNANELLSNLKEYKCGDLQVNFKDDVDFDLSSLDDLIEMALEEWLISQSMQIWL